MLPYMNDDLVCPGTTVSEEVPSGAVSFAAEIIAEAQTQNEPVAWVTGTGSIFFPPDLIALQTACFCGNTLLACI